MNEKSVDGYEILIHNVSHSDIVLGINSSVRHLEDDHIIGRPKFSNFNKLSTLLFEALDKQKKTICKPTAVRSNGNVIKGKDEPVGFDFKTSAGGVHIDDTSMIRFRGGDKNLLVSEQSDHSQCLIDAVYFPLIGILMPKWLSSIPIDNANKIVFLITGVGTPASNSSEMNDNSTEYTGLLVKAFLEMVYPNLTVISIYSHLNIFRYDDNIEFVKMYLNPLIAKYRSEAAIKFKGDWKKMFHITLSFADGSSARTSAINAALRLYKPSYMHFWQLKTFWHTTTLYMDDIEAHSYEEISTIPAMLIEHTDREVAMVVKEMTDFRNEFTKLRKNLTDDNQDLTSFWLRKTKKPVLAVLMVKKPNPNYVEGGLEEEFIIRLYRGTNMEVSMPTGSLCAERNVIGSALAADLTLKRQDLKFIAVYSACLDPIDASAGNATGSNNGTPSEIKIRSESCLSSDHDMAPSVLYEYETTVGANEPLDGSLKVDVVGSPGRTGPNSSRRLSRSVTTTQYTNQKPSSPGKTNTNAPVDLPKFDSQKRSHAGPGPLELLPSPTLARNLSVPNLTTKTPKLETPYIKKISRVFTLPRAPSTSSSMNIDGLTQYSNTVSSPSPPTFDENVKTTIETCSATNSNPHSPSRDSIKTAVSDPNLYESEKRFGEISSPYGNDLYCRPASIPNCACNDVKTTTRTFSVRESDMNPLKPCGACNEWLKKIAEVNPDFSVITFTDENCHGVYVEEIDCV